ncbi:MAG: folate family ECF transporter S component [Oscillospiraceae bacterium]|nr:folate family ECF transporter S component [Oscillospiraceae bacterium]
MKEYWHKAVKEMHNVRSLTGAALLAALSPVLDLLTITVNQFLEISFTSLTHAMTGFLYGPVVGRTAGGLADIIKYLLKPTGAFFPGFTLNEILTGVIYGVMFYKKEVKFSRVIIARLIVTVGINLTLTPLWLSMMYGNAYKFMVPARLIKNLAMLPIDIFILYSLIKFADKNLRKKY